MHNGFYYYLYKVRMNIFYFVFWKLYESSRAIENIYWEFIAILIVNFNSTEFEFESRAQIEDVLYIFPEFRGFSTKFNIFVLQNFKSLIYSPRWS